ENTAACQLGGGTAPLSPFRRSANSVGLSASLSRAQPSASALRPRGHTPSAPPQAARSSTLKENTAACQLGGGTAPLSPFSKLGLYRQAAFSI
ncbi:MAG: hypothetical protein QHH44_05340, partial [Candidatus Saccharicenans sp.]|nr:hypothetical protein [Candidatus Saccharicenans sp.]